MFSDARTPYAHRLALKRPCVDPINPKAIMETIVENEWALEDQQLMKIFCAGCLTP
jgi:hypothetical protein